MNETLQQLDFDFDAVYDTDTRKWYAYSKSLNISIEPPKEIQNMIQEMGASCQEDAFLAHLLDKPAWIYDTSAYLDLSTHQYGFQLTNDDLMDIIDEQQEDMER